MMWRSTVVIAALTLGASGVTAAEPAEVGVHRDAVAEVLLDRSDTTGPRQVEAARAVGGGARVGGEDREVGDQVGGG